MQCQSGCSARQWGGSRAYDPAGFANLGRSTGLHRQHMKLLQSGTAHLNISSKHCRAYLFTQALQCCSIHQAAIPVVYPGNAAISILVFY